MFGRATITLGTGPDSSISLTLLLHLSFTISEILSLICENLKWSCDPEHTSFGVVCHS